MNAKFRSAGALSTVLAVLAVTIGTFASPVSADPPVCQQICAFHIGFPSDAATGSKELGLQFRSDVSGWIAGVCFWEAANETGNHTVSVWDSNGTRLATATPTLTNVPGQEGCIDFNPVVPIAANSTYTASYTANAAYDVDTGQFHPGHLDDSPLHTPTDAGVSGAPGSFPTKSVGDGYGVDIAFVDTPTGVATDCASTMTAPTTPTTAPGNAYAVVSWGPAHSTPDGCIAGYVVTTFLNGLAYKQTLFNGLMTTNIVTGLTNGQTYTFTVAAESGRTLGPDSVATGPITVGTPTAASALQVSRVSNGAIKVAFKAAKKNGAPITKYTATCKSQAGGARSKAGKRSPLTVTGLTRGKTYTCRVRATNRRGNGPSSGQSAAVKA